VAAEAASDLCVLLLHPGHEITSLRVHATHGYERTRQKDANSAGYDPAGFFVAFISIAYRLES
jgi:hypothetical protein